MPGVLRRGGERGFSAAAAPLVRLCRALTRPRPRAQDARKLLQGPSTQQSIEQMAAIGQAEHWAPWQPGTPWGTTKVVNGVVVQTSEEAAQEESADAASLTPDQMQKARTRKRRSCCRNRRRAARSEFAR